MYCNFPITEITLLKIGANFTYKNHSGILYNQVVIY